jgi:hypothetical protein
MLLLVWKERAMLIYPPHYKACNVFIVDIYDGLSEGDAWAYKMFGNAPVTIEGAPITFSDLFAPHQTLERFRKVTYRVKLPMQREFVDEEFHNTTYQSISSDVSLSNWSKKPSGQLSMVPFASMSGD